jgi:Inner membrane protein YgaP-like, transmembrane domain
VVRREVRADVAYVPRTMTVERLLRLIAGTFVLLSLWLGYALSPYWYLFTAFVGLNLFQSGFTDWCPMMAFLKKLGVRTA